MLFHYLIRKILESPSVEVFLIDIVLDILVLLQFKGMKVKRMRKKSFLAIPFSDFFFKLLLFLFESD